MSGFLLTRRASRADIGTCGFSIVLARFRYSPRNNRLADCIVPVTAKLSRKFYETFGEDLTNELVEWFNSVDATYRTDLRELNELNFSRFDAKLEQRLAQFDAKLEQRLAQSDAKLDQRLAQFHQEIVERLTQLESRLTWRMFAFWAPTALAVIGSGAGVISLLLRR